MPTRVLTIGAYGFDEEGFFRALKEAGVDLFCDVRARRGVRGAEYAFVNSQRLQARLAEMGIGYVHMKDLAPSQETREAQYREDKKSGVGKRSRERLGDAFVRAYRGQVLAGFDSADFVREAGADGRSIALFCVERTPEACHRSLLASRLAHDLGVSVEHIVPCA